MYHNWITTHKQIYNYFIDIQRKNAPNTAHTNRLMRKYDVFFILTLHLRKEKKIILGLPTIKWGLGFFWHVLQSNHNKHRLILLIQWVVFIYSFVRLLDFLHSLRIFFILLVLSRSICLFAVVVVTVSFIYKIITFYLTEKQNVLYTKFK